jgi:RNA polymerase sigma factor (sigma-70 family)
VSRSIPFDPERVRAALTGDAHAMHELVTEAKPIVRTRASWALARFRGRGAGPRHDLEDLTQDVFAALFEHDGRALRAWDPALGLSFRNFIGLLTQRHVAGMLRGAATALPLGEPFAEEGGPHLDARDGFSLENHVASRELLRGLWRCLCGSLSPRGLVLFERLYLDGQPIAEVCESLGMSSHAVYQWRHRIALAAREALTSLECERGESPAYS